MQFEEAMGDGDTKRQVFHSFQELIHESGMADPNNPFVWSSLEAHSHKRLVQWCHGPPGLIPVLVTAAELWPDSSNQFLKLAEEMGEITWQEGLVKKGLGLCHGIGGNGLLLLSLAQATGNGKRNKWVERANSFALFGTTLPDYRDGRGDRTLFGGELGLWVLAAGE
eukprot:Selendium_serpulae@DN2130_c0_g1_i4.p1